MQQHLALYRKWRPADFDDVCGQNGITDILKYQVNNGRVSHAYLFCGSRGTGKTSCAKILAKAVNCLDPKNGNPCNQCAACRSIDAGEAVDVTEMDAASNTGIDHVRSIREEIVFSPAELRYRVYIIDEVHMISTSAFNALLKTLEEPPAHVVFILATTELHKLPATIISRCQRFDFRRLDSRVITARLLKVATAEGMDLDETGARLIARIAQGGMRDALSLLELCAGLQKKIDDKLVVETLGVGDREQSFAIVRAVLDGKYDDVFGAVNELVLAGRDLAVFVRELIDCYRDIMVTKTVSDPLTYLDLTDSEFSVLREFSARFTTEQLVSHSKILEEALTRIQRGVTDKRSTVEIALCRLTDARLSATPESLLARIAALEQKMAVIPVGGAPAPKMTDDTPKKALQKQKESASQEKEKAPVAAAPKEEAGDNAFRPLGVWNEVVDALCAVKPSNAGKYLGSRAYKNGDGKYIVRLKNIVFVPMVKAEDSFRELCGALSAQVGQPVLPENVRIECMTEKPSSPLIDDVIQAYEN